MSGEGMYRFSPIRSSLSDVRRSAPCATKAAYETADTESWHYTARAKRSVSVQYRDSCEDSRRVTGYSTRISGAGY